MRTRGEIVNWTFQGGTFRVRITGDMDEGYYRAVFANGGNVALLVKESELSVLRSEA